MTQNLFNQIYNLSQEEPTGIFLIDAEEETCVHCDGDGCEVCNFTGIEYPELN